MIEIDKLVKEFNSCNKELCEMIENNLFHEAGDIKSYMLGLATSMSIILDSNFESYAIEDRKKVDKCIYILNKLDNN